MSEELYEKLKDEFYKSNHAKYRRFFEVWVQALTEAQIKWWAEHWNLPYYESFNECIRGIAFGKL